MLQDSDDGWTVITHSGFVGHVGPILSRVDDTGLILGLRAMPYHHNMRGVMQGGMIATLLDFVIGRNIRTAYPEGGYATIDLNIRYFAAVEIGDFVIARGKVDSRTTALTFGSGTLAVGERIVAAGSGVWRNLRAG